MLTVISGPAGTGKTTALAAWAAESRWPGPVAWLTLDEYDYKPGTFWSYLSAAVRQAEIPLPGVRGAARVPVRVRVASALAAQRPPAILVLDNVHLLRGYKIADELARMLRQAQPGLHVIIATRGEPPLPLHQYLLTGDLTEIRADQLAFTVPEARSLLGQHDLAENAELIRDTEGWAAGLRLAAIAAHQGLPPGVANLTRADHPVSAYLTREMLDPQPRTVQDFMLRTSVVDTFTPELAIELTGQDQAAVTLAELVRANVFIQGADEGWYRYHPLFGGVLRARLQDESPRLTAVLRYQAATWFARRGDLLGVIRYATQAGEWEFAARTVIEELAISRLVDPERGGDLVDGLREVPPGQVWEQPQPFLTAAGVALAMGDTRSCGAWLGQADRLLSGQDASQAAPSQFAAAVIRFELARCGGDLDGMSAAAAEAEAALSRLPARARARHPELAVHVMAKLGAAELWRGHLDGAADVLSEASALPLPAALRDEYAACAGHLALAEALGGRLGHAEDLALRAVRRDVSLDAQARTFPNVPAEIALAWARLERGELAEVRHALKRAETGLRAGRDRAAAAIACLIAVRLHLAEGRHAVAVRMLAQAREGWQVPGWLDHRLDLAEARAQTMAGDIVAALDAADHRNADEYRNCDEYRLDTAVVRAAAWVEAGDFRAAERALRTALDAAERAPERVPEATLVDALLLDARLRYADGDRAAGRHSLGRALRIALGEYVRLPFTMEQSWLNPVLGSDSELAGVYLTLSRAAAGEARDDASHPGQPGHAGHPGHAAPEDALVVEPLTGREHEVLGRVAQLMSTVEIANELCISVNTVKTHLKSVHRKLAVTHRREAVRRAKQLKLL